MARCKEQTKKGTRCKRQAVKDEEKCASHLGRVGPRGKLTSDLIVSIAGYVEKGVPIKYACQAVGIGESTFYSWREVGEADIEHDKDTLHRELLESLARAHAEFLSAHAMNVSKHAVGFRDGEKVVRGDWRASAWQLERRGGEDWREKVDVEHSGGVRTTPVEVPDDEKRLTEVGGILQEIGALPAPSGNGARP